MSRGRNGRIEAQLVASLRKPNTRQMTTTCPWFNILSIGLRSDAQGHRGARIPIYIGPAAQANHERSSDYRFTQIIYDLIHY